MRIGLWLTIWTALALGLHGAEWHSVTLEGRYQGNGWHLSGGGPCRYDFGSREIVETGGDAALEVSFARHGKGVGFRLAGWWFCEVGEGEAVPSPLVPSPGFGTAAWLDRQPDHMAVGKWYLLRGIDGFVLLRIREFRILEYSRVRQGWFGSQTYAHCAVAFDYLAPGPMSWLSLVQASATAAVVDTPLPAAEARLVGSQPIASPAPHFQGSVEIPVPAPVFRPSAPVVVAVVPPAVEPRLIASAPLAVPPVTVAPVEVAKPVAPLGPATRSGLNAGDRRAVNREYGICASLYASFQRLGPAGANASGARVVAASALAVLQVVPDHEAFLRGEIARQEAQLAGAAQAWVAAEGWRARRLARHRLEALEAGLAADRQALATWRERRLELARIVAELRPIAGLDRVGAGGEG